MTNDEAEFLALVCKRPRMFHASASSFEHVLAFICGIRCSAKRPHGDFGDFPMFVIDRIGASRSEPWTDSMIHYFSDVDMYDACAAFSEWLTQWVANNDGNAESGPPVA